jgi:hypothetical protein
MTFDGTGYDDWLYGRACYGAESARATAFQDVN